MKLLILKFSQLTGHYLPLRSKQSPPVYRAQKVPKFGTDQSFTPKQKNNIKFRVLFSSQLNIDDDDDDNNNNNK